MRYKISHSSSNKREQDRVSSEIAERSRVWKNFEILIVGHRLLKDRRSGERSGVIHNGACPTPKGPTSKGATVILDGRERTVRANRVLENERIIKEKLGRPIHVDPPAAACRPPMTEISLISLLSAIETVCTPTKIRSNFSLKRFPRRSTGNSFIANARIARCEMERGKEGKRMKGIQTDPVAIDCGTECFPRCESWKKRLFGVR